MVVEGHHLLYYDNTAYRPMCASESASQARSPKLPCNISSPLSWLTGATTSNILSAADDDDDDDGDDDGDDGGDDGVECR